MTSACLRLTDSLTIGCWEQCFAPSLRSAGSLELKTGDLYLTAANPSGRTPGLNTIGSCRWDHVGLVWVHDDGRVYIIDSGCERYYAATPDPQYPEVY